MKTSVCYALAIALHLAVLFGVSWPTVPVVNNAAGKHYVEVALIDSSSTTAVSKNSDSIPPPAPAVEQASATTPAPEPPPVPELVTSTPPPAPSIEPAPLPEVAPPESTPLVAATPTAQTPPEAQPVPTAPPIALATVSEGPPSALSQPDGQTEAVNSQGAGNIGNSDQGDSGGGTSVRVKAQPEGGIWYWPPQPELNKAWETAFPDQAGNTHRNVIVRGLGWDAPGPPKADDANDQVTVTVSVQLVIDTTGKVSEAKVVKKSAFPFFDEAALKTVQTTKFTPALRNGVPVTETRIFYLSFILMPGPEFTDTPAPKPKPAPFVPRR